MHNPLDLIFFSHAITSSHGSSSFVAKLNRVEMEASRSWALASHFCFRGPKAA
jgi:hypothetical protein